MSGSRHREMHRRWDAFAREDPLLYITGWEHDWSRDELLAWGREIADTAMVFLGDVGGRDRLLDLGCGVGRITQGFARHFGRVDGIDVSSEMVERARQLEPPPNVSFTVGTGEDLQPFEDEAFDVVFSWVVFQHIPFEHVIASYLHDIRRVLHPDGAAALQFDSRPLPMAARLYYRLPDALLPRTHRRFIRRYRRTPERLRELVQAAGLRVEREEGAGTEYFQLLLRRAR